MHKLCSLNAAWIFALALILPGSVLQAEDPTSPQDRTALNKEPSAALRVVPGIYATTKKGLDKADGTNGIAADPVLPFAHLPVLSKTLRKEIDEVPADEMLRVIIMLRHLPQDRISAEVQARHAAEKVAIQTEVDSVLASAAARLDPTLPKDAENLPVLKRTLPQDRADLRLLNLRHEALDKVIIDEMTTELSAELAPFVQRIRSAVERFGGEFEFSTIAGSLVVARVPAGRIAELATHPDILRISEDGLLHSSLDLMDDATLVSAPGGLWDSGFDGGIFDPAIIDTGLDIYHPGMKDDTSPQRKNYYSWFLTAATANPNFADVTTQDDIQGHGTKVAGIVGSYGWSGFPDLLGTAYGVESLITLKAGWKTSTGGGRMFASDMNGIVDRALYHRGDLFPLGTFRDDVDGMNYSWGNETTEDDTDIGRFWDSVVSSHPDLPVTIAAMNTGPNNTDFSSPGNSYNAITVSNIYNQATPDRADDTVNQSSTVGPTANGRRKPDLAAPGSNIRTPSNDWEHGSDYSYGGGTSIAAPAVLGIIMDLMDAGLTDELALKALLINTAQKNEPGIDIESDSDGWDPQIGFGYMNALAAFGHRSDVFSGWVTPRGALGDYRLFKGVMRDEGPTGEGRDRATMVWNRHATYNPAAPPTTYFSLVDLNLQLYHEDDETLVDYDVTPLDNVQQVRIEPGASETPVVIKAYAWSTSFFHGIPTEVFALATEEGFTEVALPNSFTGEGSWPSSVEPAENFIIGLRIRNGAEIASHDNTLDLDLPSGWGLITGPEIQNVGSAPGSDGTSDYAVWEIQAPSLSPPGPEIIPVEFTHHSYNEPWGTMTFNVGLTLEWDTTPPRPDPMFFTLAPAPDSLSQISMQAVEATDLHDPVEYSHEYRSSPTGGNGGTGSGWHRNREYTDSGLDSNNEYCYRVLARDAATVPNTTSPSSDACVFTKAASPTPAGFGAVTHESVTAHWSANGNPDNTEYFVENTTTGADSGWTTALEWHDTSTGPDSTYSYQVRARNAANLETLAVSLGSAETGFFGDGFETGNMDAWSSNSP